MLASLSVISGLPQVDCFSMQKNQWRRAPGRKQLLCDVIVVLSATAIGLIVITAAGRHSVEEIHPSINEKE